jgi:hypothetical protein
MDRNILAQVYEQHFMPRDSGRCRCGFDTTNTEPGDRDHEIGWSTDAIHMRRMFARHLADEYNEALKENAL